MQPHDLVLDNAYGEYEDVEYSEELIRLKDELPVVPGLFRVM